MTAISDQGAASPVALERFFGVLVETIRASKPEYLRRPFTVAEIYQSLIPYRTHRDRLGVEMNGDYEDVLLRLLAGEGEFLQMESEQARSRIQKELRRKNPNPGVYREFAAAEVRLDPVRVDGSRTGATSESGARLEAPPDTTASPQTAAVPPEPTERAAGSPDGSGQGVAGAGDTPSTAAPSATERPSACATCGEALPDRASLQFCPYCGKSTRLVPCRACGEELDRSWRFCVACGEPAD